MKKIVISLLLSISSASFADDNSGLVDSKDLRHVLHNCRSSDKEVRCLRKGVRRLIKRSHHDGGSAPESLVCLAGRTGKYSVYNDEKRTYLDKYSGKTAKECNRVVESSDYYICLSGRNNKFARYNRKTNRYIDSRFSLELKECLDLLP